MGNDKISLTMNKTSLYHQPQQFLADHKIHSTSNTVMAQNPTQMTLAQSMDPVRPVHAKIPLTNVNQSNQIYQQQQQQQQFSLTSSFTNNTDQTSLFSLAGAQINNQPNQGRNFNQNYEQQLPGTFGNGPVAFGMSYSRNNLEVKKPTAIKRNESSGSNDLSMNRGM